MDTQISCYLDHLACDRERAPSTVARYRALLDRFAMFAGRELDRPTAAARDVDRPLVERFIRSGGREDTVPSAASTRNVRLAALRGLFGYLAAAGQLDRNSTAGIRAAKVKSRSPGYVTESEFGMLRATVRAHASEHYGARDVALIVLMFHAGLRISEALSLDTTQLDFESLRVRNVLRKGRVREDVAINTSVADALRRWFVYRPAYKAAGDSGAVFLSDRGSRLSARAFQRSFRRYAAFAGLADRRLTPHSLRHSCATALAERDVRIETIAEVLGHRKLDTTRIYVRIAARQKREAVALLADREESAQMAEKPRNSGLTAPILNRTLASNSARKGSSANSATTVRGNVADGAWPEAGSR
jgi:site-specific recombinase XerD